MKLSLSVVWPIFPMGDYDVQLQGLSQDGADICDSGNDSLQKNRKVDEDEAVKDAQREIIDKIKRSIALKDIQSEQDASFLIKDIFQLTVFSDD